VGSKKWPLGFHIRELGGEPITHPEKTEALPITENPKP